MLSFSRRLTAAGLALAGAAVAFGAGPADAAPHRITSGDDCLQHVRQTANEADQHVTYGHPDVGQLLDKARARCDNGDLQGAKTLLTEVKFELSQPQTRGS